MLRPIKLIGILVALAPLSSLFAQSIVFRPYEPENLYHSIGWHLGTHGVAVAPNLGFIVTDPRNQLLLRGNSLVGEVTFTKDVRAGQSELVFLDAGRKPLAIIHETYGPCGIPQPTEHCRSVVIDTELDHVGTGDGAPFEIREGLHGTEFFRYGREAQVTDWRAQLHESFRWLVDTFATTDLHIGILTDSPVGALMLGFASDPEIVPYLTWIHLTQYNGQMIVTGVLPSNAVYGLIVDRAIASGFSNIRMNVTIDTRLANPGPF